MIYEKKEIRYFYYENIFKMYDFILWVCLKIINYITESPSETASRTLKLLAKALQNLANLVEFGTKVSWKLL